MMQTQQEKNEALFKALNTPNSDIKSLIDANTGVKANVNGFDTKQGTPLICAVKAHNIDHVRQLLDAKVDVLGVDSQWHSALYHAIKEFKAIKREESDEEEGKEEEVETPQKQTRLNILFLLIQHLPSIDSEKIKQWVLRAERYWHDPAYAPSHTFLLDALASCLLGSNMNVFCKEKFLIKYAAQILSLKGTTQDKKGANIEAEGWSKDIYLMLRVRVLLGLLFKQREKLNRSAQEEDTIKQILSEIQITVETYLVTTVCTQTQDLFLKQEERKALYKIFADHVINRVSHLADGQSYCFPTGWSSHALYLVFTRRGQYVYLRSDNLGAGINKHKEGAIIEKIKENKSKKSKKNEKAEKTQKKKRIIAAFPYPLGKFELASNWKDTDSDSGLKEYLEQLFFNYNVRGIPDAQKKRELIDFIYSLDGLGEGANTEYCTPELKPRQSSKNCAYYNFQIGVEIRCGSQVAQLIQEAEHHFANPQQNYPPLEDSWPLQKEFYEPQSILPPYLIEKLKDYHKNQKIKVYQMATKEMPESFYTNLYLVEKSSVRLRDAGALAISFFTLGHEAPDFKDWFNKETLADQRILLEGEAGIGKSTLSERLAFLNATDRIWSGQFEAVLVVPLRILARAAQNKKTLAEILSDTMTYLSQPIPAIEVELLENALKAKKILLILDGADEAPIPELSSHLSTLYGSLLSYSRQVTTTRPYRFPEPLSLFNRQYRIMGFTPQLADQYVEKFFGAETKNKTGDQENKDKPFIAQEERKEGKPALELKKPALSRSARLLQGIQKNPAWSKLSRSPLLLSLCCSLIATEMETSTSFSDMRISELYQDIFNILIYRFLQKNLTDLDLTIIPREILQSPFAEGPVKFLEVLALEARTSQQSDVSLTLLETVLKQCGYSRKAAQSVLRIELLKPTSEDKIGISGCYFSHATLQDFCIARRISKQLLSSKQSKALSWVEKYRYDFQYRLVWPFIAGLLHQQSPKAVKIILNALLAEPRECGFYEIPILLSCLEEGIPEIAESDLLETRPKSSLLTEISTKFKAVFSHLLDEAKSPGIPEAWLQVLSTSPFFVKHIGLIDKITSILNRDTDPEQQIKGAYYLGYLTHFFPGKAEKAVAVLINYVTKGQNRDWQEKALYALQKMAEMSLIQASQSEKFQSLLWTVVTDVKVTSPPMRQIASEVLKKHFFMTEQSLMDLNIDNLVTSSIIKDKLDAVDELLPLIPFCQEFQMTMCIETLIPLLSSSDVTMTDTHKIAYALSTLYRLNPQKNSSLWTVFETESKESTARTLLLAAQGQSYSGFTEAVALLQEKFNDTSLDFEQGIWMARFLVDQVKAGSVDEKIIFNPSVIKYLISNMSEKIADLPKSCWLTYFPKDWKMDEIEKLTFENKLNYLPPQALFLISGSQEHQNDLLLESFLKSTYHRGLGLILRSQDNTVIILEGDSLQSSYNVSPACMIQLQEKLSQLFPILKWKDLQSTEVMQVNEEKQEDFLKKRKVPTVEETSEVRMIGSSSKKIKTETEEAAMISPSTALTSDHLSGSLSASGSSSSSSSIVPLKK